MTDKEVIPTVQKSSVQKYLITDMPRLDPISVYVENYEKGKGKIVIECYGSTWTHYWGAMGGNSITEDFVARSPVDYLVGCLSRLTDKKREIEYLTRIVTAVKAAFQNTLIGS